MLTISCDDQCFTLAIDDHTITTIPLSLRNIYQLDLFFKQIFVNDGYVQGVRFNFNEKSYNTYSSLQMELLLQVIYLSLVYYVYPRINDKSPNRPVNAREDFEHHYNSIKNLSLFCSMYNCQILNGYGVGHPAIVVAPGPSIDLDQLRGLRDKVMVIAVGRVLPRLLQSDIVPDIVYIQETTFRGWEDIFGQDTTVLDTTVICNPVGPIHAFAHRVKTIYRAWNYYPFEMDQMPKLDEIAPSSTTGAYSIARLLKADPIIFMGCDCGSIVSENSAAALSTATNLSEVVKSKAVIETPLNQLAEYVLSDSGRTILTKSDYLACTQWLKNVFFRDALQEKITFYDFSQTGLLQGNGLARPLPSDFDAPPFLKQPMPRYTVRGDVTTHQNRLRQHYTFIKRHLLRSAAIPESALRPPYNCIFTDIPRYDGSRITLDDTEHALVLARLDQLLEALG
ncbi:MAG: 6-hydroxymethylpterin diphosphokinase MptE-like protein [Solidesulfovibrio sp. DCME]|uniref:6-hydroxymethylpterin diphosphokinase MptE-like protein n=1 Tax=Solidesulfovibrio sp. DCME TaxID=3447380 RepID=UPI003D13B83A